MKVDIILSADRIDKDETRVVIVIDVLRATSTIVTALSNKANKIIPVESITKAKKKYNQVEGDILLAGERNGIKIAEFDLGNSPLEYTSKKVRGKTIILTTTNGTRCFYQLDNAEEVIVASLLNLSAIIEYIKEKEELVICCAGENNQFAMDDFLVAGKIIAKLKSNLKVDLNDKGKIAYQTYLYNQDDILATLTNSTSGQNLVALNKKKDIEYIVTATQKNVISVYKGGIIKKIN